VDVGSALQACPSVDTLLFNADWPLSSPSSIASANEIGINGSGDVFGGTIHSNVRRIKLHGLGYAFRKTEHTQRYSAYAYEGWVKRNNDINFKAIRKRRRALSSSFVGAGGVGGGEGELTTGTLGIFPSLESIRVVSPKVLSMLNESVSGR
jgi:hypothetical protein